MGDWDCFCALCAGPLNITSVDLGDTRPRALRRRRRRVEREKRKRAGEKVVAEDEDECDSAGEEDEEVNEESRNDNTNVETTKKPPTDEVHDGLDRMEGLQIPHRERDSDTWSQASELSTFSGWNVYHGTTEDEEDYNWREKGSFDPSLLQLSDIEWLHRCRVICLNADAPGIPKAYISGRGISDSYGAFSDSQPSSDPNYPTQDPDHTCYYANDNYSAFPFHEACFKILARYLGFDDPRLVNKDILYDVMEEHSSEYGRTLILDFGPIVEDAQYWSNEPGEEFAVCDPGPQPGLEAVLQSMFPATLFKNTPSSILDMDHKVQNDVLKMLPYDLIHIVCNYLSLADVISLMSASWHILITTRDNAFWEYIMRKRMPWFWELPGLLNNTVFPPDFDFKHLYLWLDSVTSPAFGMRGPASLLGVANRRRIWNTCQQLVGDNKFKPIPDEDDPEPESNQAEEILESALSPYVPVVSHPYASDDRTISAQFIRSWDEINRLPCTLYTHWNHLGLLIGISAKFGEEIRLFGDVNGAETVPTNIGVREWITAIILSIDEVDMLGNKRLWTQDNESIDAMETDYAGITGLQFDMYGTLLSYQDTFPGRNQRKLTLEPDMCIVGLTGTISPNGVISSLGLLQAPRPHFAPSATDNIVKHQIPARHLLWKPSDIRFPHNTFKLNLRNVPSDLLKTLSVQTNITPNELYSLYSFPSTNVPNGIYLDPLTPHADMLAHDAFIWPDWQYRYGSLTRLSALQVSGQSNREGSTPHFTTDIIGLKATKTKETEGDANIWAGTPGPVYAQLPNWSTCTDDPSHDALTQSFPSENESNMSHFDIHGADGEVITEVHFSPIGALKLVTNHGRECTWGEAVNSASDWQIKCMQPGEIIVGLRCCFGRLGGWSEAAKRYSHWKLSDVGVVVAKMEEESLEARNKSRW